MFRDDVSRTGRFEGCEIHCYRLDIPATSQYVLLMQVGQDDELQREGKSSAEDKKTAEMESSPSFVAKSPAIQPSLSQLLAKSPSPVKSPLPLRWKDAPAISSITFTAERKPSSAEAADDDDGDQQTSFINGLFTARYNSVVPDTMPNGEFQNLNSTVLCCFTEVFDFLQASH